MRVDRFRGRGTPVQREHTEAGRAREYTTITGSAGSAEADTDSTYRIITAAIAITRVAIVWKRYGVICIAA